VGKAMLAFLDDSGRKQCLSQQAYHAYTAHTLTSAAALSAELETIRREGVAFDREEHEPNIICIAAPILSSSHKVLGGLSITTSTQRYSLQTLENFKPDLLETARKIGEQADLWQFPESQA
jgi:DNA-binding IclR family transcriptional regulator